MHIYIYSTGAESLTADLSDGFHSMRMTAPSPFIRTQDRQPLSEEEGTILPMSSTVSFTTSMDDLDADQEQDDDDEDEADDEDEDEDEGQVPIDGVSVATGTTNTSSISSKAVRLPENGLFVCSMYQLKKCENHNHCPLAHPGVRDSAQLCRRK